MPRTLTLTNASQRERDGRLNEILRHLNMKSAVDLSRGADVHHTTITKIVREGLLTGTTLMKLGLKYPSVNFNYITDKKLQMINGNAIETRQMKNLMSGQQQMKFNPVPYISPETIENNMHIVADPLPDAISWHESTSALVGATVIISVVNDEMHPVFSKNQRIGVRHLKNLNFIQWGKPYLILAEENLFCRYIFRDEKNEKIVILKAENSFFQDMSIEKKSINHLWLVIGKTERIDY